MTTLLRTLPRRLPALLIAAAAAVGPLAPLQAAARNDDFSLTFSDTPDGKQGADFPLRPTKQQLFVFVKAKKEADVTVEVLADDAPVEGTVQPLHVKADSTTQVHFGKPPAPPAAVPGAPPAVVAAPPPPPLAEVKGALKVVLLDKDGQELASTPLPLLSPADYITVTRVAFNPDEGNKLTVEVKAGDFVGSPARVEIVLRPDRIPGLIDSNKEGTRRGYVAPGGTLQLTAENLEFDKKVTETNGLVYITIDGWERAFTYYTTFSLQKGKATTASEVQNIPVVRLEAPRFANPGAPLPVSLELDNTPSGDIIELGFDRNNDDTYSAANLEVVTFRGGDRQERTLAGASPDGALVVQREVQDWKTAWDAADVFGQRNLRLRVVKSDGGAPEHLFDSKDPTAAAQLEDKKKPTEVVTLVKLDAAAPPEGIQLAFPARLKRGADLPVQAVTADPPSEVKEVVLYLGKPGPDGQPPQGTVPTEARWDEKNQLWIANLRLPADVKDKADVTAAVVKFDKSTRNASVTVVFEPGKAPPATFENVAKNGSVTVVLADETVPPPTPVPPANPAAPGAPKLATITGTVTEGGIAQPNLEVRLMDDKGAVKDAVKTDPKTGKYVFENVAPGTYKVVAVKTVDSTRGETGVQVVNDQKKDKVDINLQRQ